MTSESKVYVGLEDIHGIRFECRGCHAKLTIPLGADNPTPFGCGYCTDSWFEGQNDARFQMLNSFLVNFKKLRDLKKLGFDLTIELPSGVISDRASGASSRDSG